VIVARRGKLIVLPARQSDRHPGAVLAGIQEFFTRLSYWNLRMPVIASMFMLPSKDKKRWQHAPRGQAKSTLAPRGQVRA
jgi:hypothetical protein